MNTKTPTKRTKNIPDDVPTVGGRLLTARPDTVDFRDRMFEPTLKEVPVQRSLESYQAHEPVILDQGREGACCGFALAAVANYLLKTREVVPDDVQVSPRMLYEMARRHDEWPGEDYSGSSARGAMKGWHKYGVCASDKWPYVIGRPGSITDERILDARKRPLGAYYRVNHRDLVAMHSALAEVGVLYATAMVHNGWNKVRGNGIIRRSDLILGGHAFAIVGYDSNGFWIQNSWNESWGKDGFAHLSYVDWLENGKDVWVARLGAPVELDSHLAVSADQFVSSTMGQSTSYGDLRPHVVTLGNDGKPKQTGDYANTADEIRQIIRKDFLRVTSGWKKKRILLYAHGGLVDEEGAIQRVADYRQTLLDAEVYPIAFVWNTDYWSILKNILREALGRRKSEGIFDGVKDFMLDRLDDTLEPIARKLTGRAQWCEMKENALWATLKSGGGARIVADEIKKLLKNHDVEIHTIAYSAGSVFMAPLLKRLSTFTTIKTCTLWAPACTVDLFREYYLPLLNGSGRKIRNMALYALTDKAERDDHCAKIYHKSLLYLVSQAFEDDFNWWNPRWKGVPLLGMEKFIQSDAELKKLMRKNYVDLVLAPNTSSNVQEASSSSSHGGFDDDTQTVKGSLARILQVDSLDKVEISFEPSASSLSDRRKAME